MVGNKPCRQKCILKFGRLPSLLGMTVLFVLAITIGLLAYFKQSALTLYYADVTSMASDQQHMYVAIDDVGVLAVSRENGKIVWQYPDESLSDSLRIVNPNNIRLEGSILYFCSSDTVYALDAIEGELLWRLQLDIEPPVQVNTLSIPGFLLVTNSNSGSTYLIDTIQQGVAWAVNFPLAEDNQIIPLSLSSHRFSVLVGDIHEEEGVRGLSKGQLYVVSVLSGKLLWTYDLKDWITFSFIPIPAIQDTDESVYLVIGSNILALDGTFGTIKWYTHWRHSVYNDLVLVEDKAVAIGQSSMFVVSRNTGEILCREAFAPIMRPRDFLSQGNQQLYFVYHTFEQQRILRWYTSESFDKSYLYVMETDKCSFDLYADIPGFLLTYDPIKGTGTIIPSLHHKLTTLRKIHIAP